MVTIYHTYFEKRLPTEVWEYHFDKLPFDKQKKISGYRRWEDAHASLFSYLLLSEALKENENDFNIDQVKHTTFGRPYINENIDFNITHSGNYVLCATSRKGKIGIDIEQIKPLDISDFGNFMTQEEWNQIHGNPDPLNAFYTLWSCKEAVMKADGRGMNIPLKEILIEGNKAQLENKTWYLNSFQFDPGYSLCLASENENPAIDFVSKTPMSY
jgi:4'-phosphopantetheinyl transferase